MSLTFAPDAFTQKRLATNQLRLWGDWMRRLKEHRKHLQRIGHSTKTIDREIYTLKCCIRQTHWIVDYKQKRDVAVH